MFMFNRIQYKIGIISAICLLVVVTAGIVISLMNNEQIEEKLGTLIVDELAHKSAQQLQAVAELEGEKVARNIEHSFSVALGIRATLETFIQSNDLDALNRERVSTYLKGLLEHDKTIMGTYVSWTKNSVDNLDSEFAGKKTEHSFKDGRFAPYWNRGGDGTLAVRPLNLQDVDDDVVSGSSDSDWFLCPLNTKHSCIVEPYSWDVQGKLTLGTSITLPLIVSNKLYGMAGIDIGLNILQQYAKQASDQLYDGQSKVYIVSSGGLLAGNSAQADQVGKKIETELASLFNDFNSAKTAAFKETENDYIAYAPIKIAELDQTWGVMIQLPKKYALAGAAAMDELMEKSFSQSMTEQIVLSLIVAVLGVLVLLWFARSIAKPIVRSAEIITDIASKDGDLTSRLHMQRKDEIGKLADGMDAFIGKTQEIVSDIAGEMRNVEGSALRTSEIAQLSNDRVGKQREQIELVAAAVTQMSANAGEVAHSAEDASQSASEVKTAVTQGANNVSDSAESIRVLATEMTSVGSVMQQLATDSENISKIVEVINGISQQTNLLALNAAIEAARAGEQGRGFSVVADEVRNLASKTQQSTLEIQQLIDKLQDRSQQAVSALEQGNEHVDVCLERAESAVQVLNSVVKEINDIDDKTMQIATASEQQAQVSENVSQNISNISDAVNEVSDDSQQSLAESEKLFELVKTLDQQLSRFKYK
jgi:methyl-accepting chemotaxis protein